MPLTRATYDVWHNTENGPPLDGAEPDFTVTITTGDQMRGERELIGMGQNMREASLTATAAFIWSALARQQLTDKPFPEWLHTELAEYNPAKLGAPVDPTTAGATGPA